jgi:hypothetical protein
VPLILFFVFAVSSTLRTQEKGCFSVVGPNRPTANGADRTMNECVHDHYIASHLRTSSNNTRSHLSIDPRIPNGWGSGDESGCHRVVPLERLRAAHCKVDQLVSDFVPGVVWCPSGHRYGLFLPWVRSSICPWVMLLHKDKIVDTKRAKFLGHGPITSPSKDGTLVQSQ